MLHALFLLLFSLVNSQGLAIKNGGASDHILLDAEIPHGGRVSYSSTGVT